MFKMDQYLIQSYLVIGDLLRIYNNQSAIADSFGALYLL